MISASEPYFGRMVLFFGETERLEDLDLLDDRSLGIGVGGVSYESRRVCEPPFDLESSNPRILVLFNPRTLDSPFFLFFRSETPDKYGI